MTALPSAPRARLHTAAIALLVVAYAAPLTVTAASPLGFAFANGAGQPANFLLIGVLLLVFAVGFTAMAPYIRNAGAFFSYIGAGLGKRAGIAAALLALVTYSTFQIAGFAFGGFLTSQLFALLGLNLPWFVWSIGVIAIVAVLSYRNIDVSVRVIAVLVSLEIAVLLVLDVGIIIRSLQTHAVFDAVSFSPTVVFGGSIGLGMLLAFGAFGGFESTVIYRDEAVNPDRTIPRATFISIIAIAVFHAVTMYLIVIAWGSGAIQGVAVKHVNDLIPLTATTFVGPWLAVAMQTVVVTSALAGSVAVANILARYLKNLGARRILPAWFGQTHPRYQSPARASIVGWATSAAVIFIGVLLGLSPFVQIFAWAATIGTISMILLLVLTDVAIIRFFTRAGAPASNRLATLVAPVIALLGIVAALINGITNLPALTGSQDPAINTPLSVTPFVVLVIGLIVAEFTRMRRPTVWDALDLQAPDVQEPARQAPDAAAEFTQTQ